MKNSTIPQLIKMFNAAPVFGEKVDTFNLNSLALKCGYFIHPDVCNEYTEDFVNDLQCNYNSTFYKCWDDVEKNNATSLLVDKLLHYASTYGEDFQNPNIYVPNGDPITIPYTEYTFIDKIDSYELYKKCLHLATQNVAMKPETLDAVCDYICWYVKEYNDAGDELNINPDSLENKEAQAIICHELGLFPTDKFALLRCIVYMCTGSSLLIKDKYTLSMIENRSYRLELLDDDQLIALSEIFYRFKPIFLALRKQSDSNKRIVNKIRRLAEKHHKPFYAGFWETVLAEKNYKTAREVANKVHELTNFKLVQLIQATRERLISSNIQAPQLYKIRNGKVYLKEKTYPMLDNRIYYWETLLEIFMEQLIENLKKKACSVKFPENLTLTCPCSEKSFLGNIPFGSYFNMMDKNFVGCYWRNEWGTRDFDLSAIKADGVKVGWNAGYKSEGLTYSGDMTNADPEACELLYCKKSSQDAILYVNRYCGEENSKFELIYGMDDEMPNPQNAMIDPNKVIIREKIISDSREKMIGAILNSKMYLMDLRVGDSMVSTNDFNQHLLQAIKRKTYCYMDLKQVLLAAGFKERKRSTKNNPIDLDLTDLNKDTLIKLFS